MMAPAVARIVGQTPIPEDSLRAVLESVFAEPAYDWRQRVDPLRWLVAGWNALTDWLAAFRDGNPVLYQWFLLGLTALLLMIVIHVAWTLVRTFQPAHQPSGPQHPRLEAERRDAAWYERRAEDLAVTGQYVAAIQAAWHALVMDLDARGLVRYRRAKTPGEYTLEPGLESADRDRLRRLVDDLYRFVFGRERCSEAEYLAWRSLAAGDWRAASS